MRAVVVTEPGGPDVLQWLEVPDPVAGAGEVVVRVTASAVNRADLLQRQGLYPPPPGAPEYPGLECSGVVESVGDGVSAWSPGDPCTALLAGGGYAELVVVPAGQLMPVPDGIGLLEAAALPEVACTVWSNVVMDAGLAAGDVLLVHGGAGGIGTFAIQAGVALGAHVAVTAGSPEKLARCRELGAEILVDYSRQDFVEAVRRATDGRGADVVLDNMGAAYLSRNVDVLAIGGRLQVIGLQGGAKGELDLGRLMSKRAQVRGTTLRARPVQEKAAICARVAAEVWPLVSDGRIRTVVDRVIPMADAAEAHRVMAASEHVGKVLLAV
ncbi:MAG TPA: NAD(P)H-quinone oxidoreductase [Candidatus Nanopelagicales bacterium]|nr:NAD(P)H-quinone oxidoreductase [Candidatus Nanopelagicales bacterium]